MARRAPAHSNGNGHKSIARQDYRSHWTGAPKPSPVLDAPTTPRTSALDYFTNVLSRMGWGTASLPESTSYEMVRLSNNYWLMLTLYRNHWLARRIVDLPAQDMTRAWPKLATDLPPDDLEKFNRTIKRTYTPRQLRKALKWARLYGGAGALIAIKGHENYLDEPLDLDDVNPGSYLGLIPFDRWVGIYPKGVVEDNLEHPNEWGLPMYYECQKQDRGESFKVHASRIIRLIGPEVPVPELQAQIYWGISVLEVIYEELRKKDNASWAILNLLFRANIIARVDPALDQLLSGLGASTAATQRYQAALQAQNELLNNQSMMVLGKDGDMKSVSYSFGGIGEAYQQFQMDTAGAAEIPVTRLFGRTVSGLGQSNDADERYYEETIAQRQEEELRPALDKLYPVICMSEFGEIPDDLDFMFPSIRVLSEEDKAELVDKASAPILASFDSGVLGRQTTLKELRQLGDTTNIFSNITDEDIDSAEKEPELPGEGLLPEESGAAGGPGKPKSPRALLRATGVGDAHPIAKRLKWHGLDISIENEAGSTREGTDRSGKHWSTRMTHDYGYLRKTEGVDGDAVDVFMGLDPDAREVYIIHTLKSPDFIDFDEDKCMLDFSSAGDAKSAFLDNFDNPQHYGSMTIMPVEKFIARALSTKTHPRLLTDQARTYKSVRPKIDAKSASYMELPGAVKDRECLIVFVEGGVSSKLGCCNEFKHSPDSPKEFRCGTCKFVE